MEEVVEDFAKGPHLDAVIKTVGEPDITEFHEKIAKTVRVERETFLRFVGRAPITHHVTTDRAVGDLRTEIDRVVPGVERIKELLEAFPLPRDAFGHSRARDVLHALHQFDQPLVTVGRRRSEADATVAHHDRGDTVPGRWREVRIPRRLSVIVRVNVHPARSEEEPGSVDFTTGVPTFPGRRHLSDQAVRDRDISRPALVAGAINEIGVANHEVVHYLTVALRLGWPILAAACVNHALVVPDRHALSLMLDVK